jgi:hypothetical protein
VETRKRALVGELISRASVEAARDASLDDLDAALAVCDHERAATIAFARARAGQPLGADVIARILPGIELPAITCSLVAITPDRARLIEVLERRLFPLQRDAGDLEALVLYGAWRAGAETSRVIPPLRRLASRNLTAESYALLATIAAAIDDANVKLATKPLAPFAKEHARSIATDERALTASLDAVLAELPAEVDAAGPGGFTVRGAKQVGRNDPCPCGSRLKYKKCCADKPQAAPSPVPGLSWDAFLTTAADRIEPDHIEQLALRDLVRVDLSRLLHRCLRLACRRFVAAHEWAHAERTLDEMARRAHDESGDYATRDEATDDFRYELVLGALYARRLDIVRAHAGQLSGDARGEVALELAIAEGGATAWAALVEAVRRNVGTTDKLADVELAHSLLRAEPALGIYFARACIGSLNIDSPDTLLEVVEEARDELNLPPEDPAWQVFDALWPEEPGETGGGVVKGKPTTDGSTLQAALATATARADQLERTLAATRAELDAARTRPAAELMRAPESASGHEARVRELEGLIREGNAERRELRKQLEQSQQASARDSQTVRRVERRELSDEHDEGFEDDLAEPGARDVVIPQFERRFTDALDGVPAPVAAEAMRTVGALAAGDGVAWRGTKQAKDMARQVLMARVGIHHRLLFRVEDGRLEVLDLITREQLLTTLKRLRANR